MSEDEEGIPERALPPIHHIREPHMQHMSTRIRWYFALGYKAVEIQKRTGVLYQQVRNVIHTQPKRAAREDLPPLVIEVLELDDDLEAMDKHHFEIQMAAQRDQGRKAAARARNGASKRTEIAHLGLEADETDEITELGG